MLCLPVDEAAVGISWIAPGKWLLPPSNVIRVLLPELSFRSPVTPLEASARLARQHLLLKSELENFGPVCRAMPVTYSNPRLVEVMFYTEQAATAAKDFYGDQCMFQAAVEPPKGPGSKPPPTSILPEAQKLRGVGASSTEFRRMAAQEAKPLVPAHLKISQLNWRDLESGLEQRRTLLLRGLPRQLCSQDSLRRVLEEAGLSHHVVQMKAVPMKETSRVGSMMVQVTDDASATSTVARFFHGRQFGVKALPVSVSFSSNTVRDVGANLKPVPSSLSTQTSQDALSCDDNGYEHLVCTPLGSSKSSSS
ncbi:unnamed protein product [Polarella glacialis]|uniref:Uncharacterized protein n=1 Tax=Polarella glacialis TaxID=89957 RepID=A0A813HG93_POLGL|nr:unnamed protein product [Polarella glacialis]|mmetsp:Transcript_19900/g.35522  ORF Transcript_19900/g.35522 Transcript_19900/m.35522 type:complete len:308 (+) Transcript_19900:116-1039(+)